MKDLFLRFCRWALPMLGVTGVISCDNVIESPDMYGCPPVMYGPEPVALMQLKVTGRILDGDTGEPVKGISVSSDQDFEDPEVITSSTGEFVYESQAYPTKKILLKFEDVDYFEDGAYMPSEIEVELVKVQDAEGAWHEGYFVAEDVLVELDPEPIATPEYGTPVSMFSVKGRVVDADMNPIKNIEVSTKYWYETVRTEEDGSFHFTGEDVGMDPSLLSLQFTDTDGEENGGEFETKTVDVPLEQTDPGDGNWDMGDYTAEDVEIVLTRKDSED